MPPCVIVVMNDVAGVIGPDGQDAVVDDLWAIHDDEDVSVLSPGLLMGEVPGHDVAATRVREGLDWSPAAGTAGGQRVEAIIEIDGQRSVLLPVLGDRTLFVVV